MIKGFISLACSFLYVGFADDLHDEPKYVLGIILTLPRTALYVCLPIKMLSHIPSLAIARCICHIVKYRTSFASGD